MGRPEEKELEGDGKGVTFNLTNTSNAEFQLIANRDTNGNKSKLARRVVLAFLKAHKAGNTSYTLDDFGKNSDMIAIPALMSNRDVLAKYVKAEIDRKELVKVKEQCEFFLGILNDKLLNAAPDDSPEAQRIAENRRLRFLKQNDLRFKDPKKMSWNEQLAFSRVKEQLGPACICPNEFCGYRYCHENEDDLTKSSAKCPYCHLIFLKPEPKK